MAEKVSHWARDASLIVAGATVLVYLVGYFRTTAYYSQLGVPAEELPFDLPAYMVKSTPVLVLPVFTSFLALMANVLGREIGRRHSRLVAAREPQAGATPEASPPFPPNDERPLRVGLHPETVALILVVGFFLYEALPGRKSAMGVWDQGWLYSVGITILVFVLAWRSKRTGLEPPLQARVPTFPSWFKRWHKPWFMTALKAIFALGLLGVIWWIGEFWTAVFSTLGAVFALLLGALQLWLQRRRSEKPPKFPGHGYGSRVAPHAQKLGRSYFAFVAAYFLIVVAILQGLHVGQSAAGGCESAHVIAFDPQPANLDSNRTYWLVLHANSNYYLRDVAEKPDNKTVHLVPDNQFAATMSGAKAIRDC
ncbi:MAG: hypothetical protein QOD77_620 [Thermoplasmata archaeon]|jgi:hypothetical protein|nr:hypothetical protein [Thermoplasmata archaeon]